MKKFISLFTTLSIVFSMLGTFMVFADETAADLEISTLAELEAFRDDVNNGNTYEGKTVTLTADIDMSDKYGEGKESWTPIGLVSLANSNALYNPFKGTFNGNGHKISNLYLFFDSDNGYDDENAIAAGLFGSNRGTIKNLNVSGSIISNYYDCSGGIAGDNNGVIEKCSYSGYIESRAHMGGNDYSNDITDCYYLEGTYDIGVYINPNEQEGTDTTVALTAEQFADKTNFANWDFDTVWEMDADLGRPVLQSNKETASSTPTPTIEPTPIPTPMPPIREVVVAPPAVDVESGAVPYGTKINITPTDAHVAYSVNGGEYQFSYFAVSITITEDTTLSVKSWVDYREEGVSYLICEETYTYTVDNALPTATPAAYPYEIVDLSIDVNPSKTVFAGQCEVKKNTERGDEDCLLVAAYDTTGALISIIKKPIYELPVNQVSVLGFTIQSTEKPVGSIKVFVWDGLNGMKPLAQTEKSSFTEQ